ncbi:MAG: SDR family oxidoreductase [Spirosomataceae bacterium]
MNKLMVVSGGTKGIGRAIIEKFASQGFDIITCARNSTDLEALVKTFFTKLPDISLLTFTADLSNKTDRKAFIDFIHQQNRPVDVLVNNTGVFLPGQIHNEPEGTLETMIETNLYSAYDLTRGVIGGMMSQRSGYIINVCSTASIMAYPNGGSYGISKFALLGMSKTLREEMKSYGVKVTAILPGATFTDSWAGVELPQSRFMHVNDIAELLYACYKLSPSAVVEEILMRPMEGDI